MKRTPLKTWMIAAVLLLGAATGSHAHGDKAHGQIRPAALDSLYHSYLKIHKALARDDIGSARKESEAFLNKPIELPEELSHTIKAKDLLQDYRALSKAENIQAGREAFRGLSEHMVVLMSEAYTGQDSVLVFFCPMANGKKGARWVQEERKLANPYYGKSMLTCGSMKTQIAPSAAKKTEKAKGSGTGATHAH
jgi:hypothetical protein